MQSRGAVYITRGVTERKHSDQVLPVAVEILHRFKRQNGRERAPELLSFDEQSCQVAMSLYVCLLQTTTLRDKSRLCDSGASEKNETITPSSDGSLRMSVVDSYLGR